MAPMARQLVYRCSQNQWVSLAPVSVPCPSRVRPGRRYNYAASRQHYYRRFCRDTCTFLPVHSLGLGLQKTIYRQKTSYFTCASSMGYDTASTGPNGSRFEKDVNAAGSGTQSLPGLLTGSRNSDGTLAGGISPRSIRGWKVSSLPAVTNILWRQYLGTWVR